ncbi:hypothetical protein HOLleu_38405 [Holothuria leucospilota]|uniref:Helix-turn-helix domain-containing protein n=1 Tax=Holothuria leucospilota TaxID=206669 RepID=A0A9Q1BDC4_HOLLE|nr:hypothetical protein HOLleu_38405 [Holothuria leucospilota]
MTAKLLNKAPLDFASNFNTITPFEKHVIFQAKKTMLFNAKSTWCKRTDPSFEVTMGSFDGTETWTYKPYLKPNNTPLYVHKQSNHPPLIIRNIPESINRRLTNISSNETTFNTTAPVYQEALLKSGYGYHLRYKPQSPNTRQHILTKHNLQPATQNNCNCRAQTQCPLEGNCLANTIVYQATVTRHDNNKEESYIGLTENTFKTRYTAHKSSFNHKDKRNATTLSEYIWKLKDTNVEHTVKWKLISKARAYTTSSKTCNLCLEEKFFIIHKPSLATLNKRNELISSCRHRNKHLLCNYSNR